MYEDFFAQRLAKLRPQKNVSAREMSRSIGLNESYINRIENGKAFPKMQVFFYICEYLNITPEEFFAQENENPERVRKIIEKLKRLNSVQQESVENIILAMEAKRK